MNKNPTRFLSQKLRLTLGAVVIILPLVVFQNCAQPASLSADTGLQGQNAGLEYNKISTSHIRSLVLTDLAQRRDLEVNLDTGVIVPSNGGARLCLPQQDLSSIVNLLNSSEICEPVLKSNVADMVCTAIYKFPYAELRSTSAAFKLGEKLNGCDSELDLCGQAAGQLKTIVTDILSRLNSMACR